ncbi:hypothetical protein QJS10_CPA05g00379 [Acorus calamus]|uniref:Uncharacterized protein n=1 Tax=Acorus calamus TaxID=4465 RepID=A0AAV9EVV7_ACOCL|nr:hypothetical protein QJS10_CPA05g00379 [Acorus calamus]
MGVEVGEGSSHSCRPRCTGLCLRDSGRYLTYIPPVLCFWDVDEGHPPCSLFCIVFFFFHLLFDVDVIYFDPKKNVNN